MKTVERGKTGAVNTRRPCEKHTKACREAYLGVGTSERAVI